MKKFIIIGLFFLFLSQTITGQQWITGRVIDSKGAGLPDIVVSDGYTVVKSDSLGTFFFDTRPGAKFVYVSTPNGFDHEGSFYQRLDHNTGSYTFKLTKRESYPNFFIHTGDTETGIYKEWVTLFKSYVNNSKPAFVLFNGDICYEKGLKFHAQELNSSKLGVRTVFTLGNHDLVNGSTGEELFEELFGPAWYSFNINGVHFVVLPVLQGDRKPAYTADILYSWLKCDLEALTAGTPVIIFNHHLWGFDTDFVLKTKNLELDLKAYNLKAYLYAHYHTNIFHKTLKGGVSTISTMSPNKGGKDHAPSSFRRVSFSPQGDVSTKLIYSPLDKHLRATAFEDEEGRGRSFLGRERRNTRVVATVYDTPSDVINVSAVVGKRDYKMTRISDFNWSVSFPSNSIRDTNLVDAVKIKAEFSDGSVIVKPADFPVKARVAWSSNLGGPIFMATPVITDKYVISAITDDDMATNGAIIAVDKSNGKEVWRVKAQNSIKNRMELWGGMLFASDVEGRVYAVDVSRGSLKWSRELRSRSIHPIYTQGVTVYDGVVYAGQGNFLTAMRAKDGKVLWVNDSWNGGVSTIASPVVEPGSGVLLTAGYWSGRYAHKASDGKLIWEKKDNITRYTDNSPFAFGGSLFYTSPNYITEVDPLSGEERAKVKIPYTVNSYSKPVVTDRYYIVGTTDKGVVAFNRQEDYKEIWNFRPNPGIFYTAPYTMDHQLTVESSPLLYSGGVYFGANDGYLYCVDSDTGVFRWRFNLGTPVLTAPVIENGILYIADFAGNLWALRI
jgi:outer membrane protein assembly factor BamB